MWMKFISFLVFGLFAASCVGARRRVKDTPQCFYNNCPQPKPDALNVHLICHSHDDVGWLKTVDQYFWGTNKSIAPGAVEYVLNTVVRELQHDPRKRFTYVESAYFWRWWMIQHDAMQHSLKSLVNNGQLEFSGGGWVSNDEATTHYRAIIDQMAYGVRKLNETFGVCGRPKIAWQIDAFGHSREQAALFAQMGFDAVFFSRLHDNDRAKRKQNKDMEFVWKASPDLPDGKGDLFTGVMYNDYGPPPGFCFDEDCDDDPMIDDRRFAEPEEYNVDKKVDAFLAYVRKQAKSYKTNNIMLTMGGDFQFRNANKWFMNLDKLIQYVNNRETEVHVFYSSPSCYVKALNDAKQSWSTKTDDFFPYASSPYSYWTGFFTSRPTLKGFIRESNNLLQVCKQMDAMAQLGPSDLGDMDVMKEAMAVLQHHDAVSGTAQQHVTSDYARRLYRGVVECEQVFNDAIKSLSGGADANNKFCPLMNTSICDVSRSSSSFNVTIFNGMSQPQSKVVMIPVDGSDYTVQAPSGATVLTQIVKTMQTTQFPSDLGQQAAYQLFFPVTLPAIGFATYHVERKSVDGAEQNSPRVRFSRMRVAPVASSPSGEADSDEQPQRRRTLSNEHVQLIVDTESGSITAIRDRKTGRRYPFTQNFYWYKPALYTNDTQQASGAYIFRPNGTEPVKITPTSGTVSTAWIQGNLVQEFRQTITPWLMQIVRLYNNSPSVEFEWTVGPIPVDNMTLVGKEIITRYETPINNAGAFYTDANGRQIISRMRNFQPTYQYNNSEPVAGNYYPINSRIFIKDDKTQLTILTDRSQGGSSMKDGSVELMIHRRLLECDAGPGSILEPLNETQYGQGLVVRGRHWIILSGVDSAPRLHRQYATQMFYQPIFAFLDTSGSSSEESGSIVTNFTGLRTALPPNVNVLTAEQWQKRTFLLRLEHTFQKGEDSELSRPVTLNLANMFTSFDIVNIQELALAANEPIDRVQRLVWQTASASSEEPQSEDVLNSNENSISDDPSDALSVTLNPMEIRTFRCDISVRG